MEIIGLLYLWNSLGYPIRAWTLMYWSLYIYIMYLSTISLRQKKQQLPTAISPIVFSFEMVNSLSSTRCFLERVFHVKIGVFFVCFPICRSITFAQSLTHVASFICIAFVFLNMHVDINARKF